MKGEVAAFSVRAQRCQCHYISTTPRTVAVLHNQLKPGHRTMSGNKIATRVAFTMCNIHNPFCAIFFINLCYIHHSLCVIFIIYFMLYSSFILCYIHHIIFAIFIIYFMLYSSFILSYIHHIIFAIFIIHFVVFTLFTPQYAFRLVQRLFQFPKWCDLVLPHSISLSFPFLKVIH